MRTLDAYHPAATGLLFGLGALTFFALLVVTAPYGRHARAGWGPLLPGKVGWVLMESPAVLLFGLVFVTGPHRAEAAPLALFALWQLHYVHRTVLFPLRMARGARPIPWLIVLLGATFNCLNGWLNARWIVALGEYPDPWLTDPCFLLGSALFLLGMIVNIRSDAALLALRRRGQGYLRPRGGLFEYVCSPNYLGEVLEWSGWAVATWSLPGLAFAVYTFANLAPRATAHRTWYRERFPDFPRERRALIPFVL